MREEEYTKIETAMKKAEESTVPFPVQNDDGLYVVGDANKTEKNLHDFSVTFRIPKKEDGVFKYEMKTVEYKDVFISPRQDQKVLEAATTLAAYFKKADAQGNVTELTDEEKRTVFSQFDDKFYDTMYDLVAAVLGIDPSLKECMMPGTVLEATAQIIEMFPEVINEADTFFA